MWPAGRDVSTHELCLLSMTAGQRHDKEVYEIFVGSFLIICEQAFRSASIPTAAFLFAFYQNIRCSGPKSATLATSAKASTKHRITSRWAHRFLLPTGVQVRVAGITCKSMRTCTLYTTHEFSTATRTPGELPCSCRANKIYREFRARDLCKINFLVSPC